MNHFIPIDKLMQWRGSCWSKLETKSSNLVLRIIYDQLLILADNKVLGTFNMHQNMKGFYKDDVLILIVSNARQEIRKLRFQIKSDVAQCLQSLGQHFVVVNHSSQHKNVISPRYRNIEDVLKSAIEITRGDEPSPLPPSYGNFVRLCLLDPSFPQLVRATQNIINGDILNK